MKNTLILAIPLILCFTDVNAGGWDDFAQGMAETIADKQERRDNQRRIIDATTISNSDVDVLTANYRYCLESSRPEESPEKMAYFERKIKAAKNNPAKIEQIKQEFLRDGQEDFERRRDYCNTQLESQKQQIIQQRAAQVMTQQQQEITQQKNELEQIKQQNKNRQAATDSIYFNSKNDSNNRRNNQELEEQEDKLRQAEREKMLLQIEQRNLEAENVRLKRGL